MVPAFLLSLEAILTEILKCKRPGRRNPTGPFLNYFFDFFDFFFFLATFFAFFAFLAFLAIGKPRRFGLKENSTIRDRSGGGPTSPQPQL